jgi:hypothetical protein
MMVGAAALSRLVVQWCRCMGLTSPFMEALTSPFRYSSRQQRRAVGRRPSAAVGRSNYCDHAITNQ